MKELQKQYHRYLIILSNRLAYDEEVRKDLYQEGLIGLSEAQQLYDDSKGTFHSFAIMRMKGRMLKFLTKYSRTIHIPANQLNESRRTVHNLPTTISTNTPINEDNGTIEDLLGCEDVDNSLEDADEAIAARLRQCFALLKHDYQTVISMRLNEDMTWDEIGEIVNRSGENCRQKFIKGIQILKDQMLKFC
jgi:RNA polymerase sigma factor (sigma-70 family)